MNNRHNETNAALFHSAQKELNELYYYDPDYRQVYPYYPYGVTYPEVTQPAIPTVPTPTGAVLPTAPAAPDIAAALAEESYIENILRFNRGKIGTFYFTYENNTQWNAKVYRGRIETAGRDHIIISDPQTGKRYLLLMVNLDYVEFDEPLAYIPPRFPATVQQQLTTDTRE